MGQDTAWSKAYYHVCHIERPDIYPPEKCKFCKEAKQRHGDFSVQLHPVRHGRAHLSEHVTLEF